MPAAIIATLIAQGIQLLVSAVSKGTIQAPDAAPAISHLIDAMGHVTGETDAERAARRSEAEAIFSKHAASLIPEAPKP